MKRIPLLALALTLAACGGDDKSSAKESQTTAPTADAGSQGVRCGAETCSAPADAGAACCMDRFTGGCGMMIADICRPLPSDKDNACPEPDLSGLAWYTAGSGATQTSSISGCCAPNNECGFNLGIGLGCTPAAQACALLPRVILERHKAQTCDGQSLELPADCGFSTE